MVKRGDDSIERLMHLYGAAEMLALELEKKPVVASVLDGDVVDKFMRRLRAVRNDQFPDGRFQG